MTRITKPAGVGLQLLGALLAFIGFGTLLQGTLPSFVGGAALTALGVWLFRLGRRPAVER